MGEGDIFIARGALDFKTWLLVGEVRPPRQVSTPNDQPSPFSQPSRPTEPFSQPSRQMKKRNLTLNDTSRMEYLQAYIGGVLDAVRNGSNTKGYFVWTFLDCLELLDGFGTSFGIYYVDLDDNLLTRYQKLSAKWYSSFLKGKKENNMPNAITRVGDEGWSQ
ncbi:glycosyl hydrolase 1 [Castilleja foliolosa]|uniref:Glycosyl hydrolase 1 n=1 Tax=Castilleja foliolosa TaxID=1961234 RepID=A0ABD3DR45_9LAMI